MVKISVSVFIAAALASSALAQEFDVAEDVLTRDVAAPPSAQPDLFGRAAIKVLNDLLSREELSEMFGRDVDELSQRELEELFEREVEFDEELAARQEPTDLPTDLPVDLGNSPPVEGGETGTTATNNGTAGAPSPQATPAATETPEPENWAKQAINFFANLFSGKPAPGANEGAGSTGPKPAPTTTPESVPVETPAAEAPLGGAPSETTPPPDGEPEQDLGARFSPSDFLEEPVERSLDYADQLDEREFDGDEMEEREFDEAEVVERGFAGEDEWDEELLRRAFDLLQRLEQLD